MDFQEGDVELKFLDQIFMMVTGPKYVPEYEIRLNLEKSTTYSYGFMVDFGGHFGPKMYVLDPKIGLHPFPAVRLARSVSTKMGPETISTKQLFCTTSSLYCQLLCIDI